jgi:Na+/H+ antiporter NhaD/arsenite permease-like protein
MDRLFGTGTIFAIAYVLVILEETTQLRKSKPVLVAAGLIWALIGMAYTAAGTPDVAKAAAAHTIYEYGELFLFLLVAITYVNTLEERRVFEVVRPSSPGAGFPTGSCSGSRACFLSSCRACWTTSPRHWSWVRSCLRWARNHPHFVALACINVVVAANAGGAFTPFGDITTLMVWQKGKVAFFEFFALLLPSLVNWLVPAAAMHLAVPREKPLAAEERCR